MLNELRIAITKGQKVSIKTTDGKVMVGLPKGSVDPDRVKIHTQNEIVSIPLTDINHVMRIINFP